MGFEHLLQLLTHYKYFLLIPGTMFLGPIVSIGAGVLIRFDVLELVPTWLALAGGELAGDVLWYWLGFHYGEPFVVRWGKYVGITDERIEIVKREYHRYHDWIIFISKVTAGFGIAPVIFFTAGLSKVPFGRYMLINVIGQVVWTSTLVALGYYLGEVSLKLTTIYDYIFYGVAVIILFTGLIGLTSYMRGRIEKSVK